MYIILNIIIFDISEHGIPKYESVTLRGSNPPPEAIAPMGYGSIGRALTILPADLLGVLDIATSFLVVGDVETAILAALKALSDDLVEGLDAAVFFPVAQPFIPLPRQRTKYSP